MPNLKSLTEKTVEEFKSNWDGLKFPDREANNEMVHCQLSVQKFIISAMRSAAEAGWEDGKDAGIVYASSTLTDNMPCGEEMRYIREAKSSFFKE